MQIVVLFPDGDVVLLAPGMIFTITGGNTVTVYLGSNAVTVKTYACGYAWGAAAMLDQLASANGPGRYYNLTDPSTPRLAAVTPGLFNIVTDQVTIIGTGFAAAPAAGGRLFIEDGAAPNNMDSNGYSMAVTWLDARTLTAVYGSAGDGVLPAGPCIVYYQDANGVKSNGLVATVDAGKNVTMP